MESLLFKRNNERSELYRCTDNNLRADGVGDVAFLVGFVVEVCFLFSGGLIVAAVGDSRVQGDLADPEDSLFVSGHDTDSGILIAIDHDSGASGDVDETEHMATGNGGDERFLGIDIIGVGIRHAHYGW
jgi:hypothetical protein